jgi:hypothetical protein
MRYIVAAAVLALMGPLGSQGALAFEETTVGAREPGAKVVFVLELLKEFFKVFEDVGKGLTLTPPEIQLTPGTEVRIPGLGKVGVLPKLDFGLELLYGANEQKGTVEDKTNPDDVQLRGTIKHRF